MNEEILKALDQGKIQMQKAVDHTAVELSKIRAGKAMPSMLDGLMVEYYGNPSPLSQVSNVSSPDARTLTIKPWDKGLITEIEKAIINSDLGVTPQNDGEFIRINIPPLTEERRKGLVKQAKGEGENGKISIRNIRQDLNTTLKRLQKEGASEDAVKAAEDDVQTLTDTYSKKVDDLIDEKEKDIMTV
jgi:ribosome recycling factor